MRRKTWQPGPVPAPPWETTEGLSSLSTYKPPLAGTNAVFMRKRRPSPQSFSENQKNAECTTISLVVSKRKAFLLDIHPVRAAIIAALLADTRTSYTELSSSRVKYYLVRIVRRKLSDYYRDLVTRKAVPKRGSAWIPNAARVAGRTRGRLTRESLDQRRQTTLPRVIPWSRVRLRLCTFSLQSRWAITLAPLVARQFSEISNDEWRSLTDEPIDVSSQSFRNFRGADSRFSLTSL